MKLKAILGMIVLMVGVGAATSAAATEDLWLHIKVNDASEDSKVDVTLPLALIQASMPLLPSEARTATGISIDSKEISLSELRRIWRQLMQGPDATYITVRNPDEHVQVAKRGSYLVVHSEGHREHGEQAEIKMPLRVVEALLTGEGDRFNMSAALTALAEAGEGELVTVNGNHETVRIWIDHRSDSR